MLVLFCFFLQKLTPNNINNNKKNTKIQQKKHTQHNAQQNKIAKKQIRITKEIKPKT